MAKKAMTIKASKNAVAIVPMQDKTAQLDPLTNTAKDGAIRCPLTRRDEFRTIQAGIINLSVWLKTLTDASVVIKAAKTYHNEIASYDAAADDIIAKTWTITRYAETAQDDAEGIRLDVNALKRACATAERLKYRFMNVSLKNGNIDFTK